ncbi:MAG: major capsid protein [Planctomycetaceae bacterium]|nr:major capsid protein [Planctomycetaceae bacterium]
MALDEKFLFNPRTMMAALRQASIPKRFLQQTFFANVETFATEEVGIDIEKTQRCIAGFTAPDNTGNVVDRKGYFTVSTKPSYIKEMMPTRVADLLKRLAGETIYDELTPMARAAKLLGKDLAQLEERIIRREEVMCAEALFTGKLHIVGPGINRTIDFGYEDDIHKKVLSGSSMWDAGGDPLEDVELWRSEIIERCGISPTHAICGRKVVRAIRNNPKVQEKLDNRRFEMGLIQTKDLGNGVRYIGTFNDSMLDLYAYDEWYVDPADKKSKPMVPEDTILLASTEARTRMNYGLIQNLNGLSATTRFPWTWQEQDGRARFVQLESAPLPNLIQADAFQVARVVA